MKPATSPALRRQIVARDTFLARVAEGLGGRVAALRDALPGPLPEPARAALEALSGFSRELDLIARPEASVGGEGCASLDLAAAVRRVVDGHGDEPVGRGIRFSGAGGVRVACAPGDVETVLLELLSNAVKYGEGPIAVRVEATPSHARLTIRDEGAGIPPGHRREVVGRFVRGPNAGSGRGFGVGLWLVRKIARGYGGELRLGEGATFCVTLPLAPAGGDPGAARGP